VKRDKDAWRYTFMVRGGFRQPCASVILWQIPVISAGLGLGCHPAKPFDLLIRGT